MTLGTRSSLLYISVFLALLATDLLSKKYITDHLNYHLSEDEVHMLNPRDVASYRALFDGKDIIPILGDKGRLFRYELHFNNRFSFSIGPNSRILNIIVTGVAILILLGYRLANKEFGHPLAWSFIFAGAMGNLIDKMFLKSVINRDWIFSLSPVDGYISGVVDFFAAIWFGMSQFEGTPLFFLGWHVWPIFNVADVLINIGIGLLIFMEWVLPAIQNRLNKKNA